MSGVNVKQSINQNILTFIFSMLLIVVGEYACVSCCVYYAFAYSVSLAAGVSTILTLAAYTKDYCAKKSNKCK